jgi:hypothetical protein
MSLSIDASWPVTNIWGSMRKGLRFIPVGVIVALALMATNAWATAGAGRTASACSNLTVKPPIGGKLTLRLLLRGRVTCAEAQRTVRAYWRPGLKTEGSGAFARLPGGWICGHVSTIEEKGGLQGGCERKGAKITEYKVSLVSGSGSATLHLESFLSPDRKVWCQVETSAPSELSCGTKPEPPTWEATLDKRGNVELCEILHEAPPSGHAPPTCFQNWPDPGTPLPLLPYGRQTELEGYRCSSATNGITCTRVAGPGKGDGFRVSKDEAVRVR